MEVISIIVMFLFGNMNDTEDRMTQYIPMSSISECLKEKRELTRNKEFKKDAFCGEALVEIKDGEVIDQAIGALSKAQLLSFLEQHI